MQGVGVDDVKSPSSPMLRVPVNMSKLAQQSDNFKKANNETKPKPVAVEHVSAVFRVQLPRFWGDTVRIVLGLYMPCTKPKGHC